ncbi:excitatory amino acid transporter 3-like isoform X2 [Pseudoliparis swirei]|uniref:excitatory amino acid transporter 3-like isoform X2 n=1 Tax=Pseudoliparis swirei TaxID=2059687 RepID=UPI0024BD774D|nr:excitatory amino acid transporter 3-like isoform X2 [Pseudoliparis swirei]
MENIFNEEGNIFNEEGNIFTEEGNIFNEEGNIFTEEGNIFTEEGNIFNEEGNIFTEEGNPAMPPWRAGVYLLRNAFAVLCLTAEVLGVALGCFIKFRIQLTQQDQFLIVFPVEVLQRLIDSICLLLIFTSVITSFSGLSGGPSVKVFRRVSAYVVSTTLLSMALGLVLVLTIKPGLDAAGQDDAEESSLLTAVLDIAWNISPANLFAACYQQDKTEWVELEIEPGDHRFSLDKNVSQVEMERQLVESTNDLGLVIWAFAFGAALTKMGTCGQILMNDIAAYNNFSKKFLQLVLRCFPVVVVFKVASIIIEVDDWELAFKLTKFIGVVVLGLVIHGAFVLPLIYFLCVRRNPYAFIKGIFPALKTAFTLSSSSAALPLSLQCCEERLRVDRTVSRFMLPIETDINKHGTVLYEVVAVIFVAQLNHVDLNLKDWVTIALTAAACSFTAAGMPSRGAATTFSVLTVLGLPAKETSLLVVIEYFLDRCNTVINVLGDCIGVTLVDRASKRDLEVLEELGQKMERWNDSDAEARTPDEILVHISRDNTISTPPQLRRDQDQNQEDSGPVFLFSPPESWSDQSSNADTSSSFRVALRRRAPVMADVHAGPLSLIGLEDELTCSICLSPFDCPVTIPCGHNFCQGCLLAAWKDSYSCPQCRTHFATRPELKKNTVLSSVVQSFTLRKSEEDDVIVRCDSCMEAEASQTCLTCMASYCEEHLRPHRDNPAFRLHQLSRPLGDLSERICPDHHKLMELFCSQHSRPICSLCLQQVHKGCPFISPEERRNLTENTAPFM